MKGPRDHALGLLAKASHDLIAARATLATGEALDMVCFHAQQAAEKSLKALLALKDVVYPWRHDIGELLKLVREHFPGVDLAQEDLLGLSPFAVEARYDIAWAPDDGEARKALAIAERAHETVSRAVQDAADGS
jgi:HEPN domain-containing protein